MILQNRYLLVLQIASLALVAAPRITQAQRLPLAFDGKNLAGWRVPEGNIWWSVEKGVLKVESDPKRLGSELWTVREYDNFVMELEFKFGKGTVDSGVFVRNSREQIQIGISGSLKRDMTASPYIAGKGYPVEARGIQDLLDLKDWNLMTIVAKEKTYSVWLNNQHVMTYESETAAAKGPIGLHLHPGNTMSIHFRNIRIADLK